MVMQQLKLNSFQQYWYGKWWWRWWRQLVIVVCPILPHRSEERESTKAISQDSSSLFQPPLTPANTFHLEDRERNSVFEKHTLTYIYNLMTCTFSTSRDLQWEAGKCGYASLFGSPPLSTSTGLCDMCGWCLWKGFIEVRLWDREYFQNFTPSYLRQAASGKRHYWLKNCSAWAVLCVHWVVWTMQYAVTSIGSSSQISLFYNWGAFHDWQKGAGDCLPTSASFYSILQWVVSATQMAAEKKWSSSCKSFFTRLPWCIRLNARRWFFPPAAISSSDAVQSHAAAAEVQRSLGFCTLSLVSLY